MGKNGTHTLSTVVCAAFDSVDICNAKLCLMAIDQIGRRRALLARMNSDLDPARCT